MKTFRGYMKNEHKVERKKNIYIIIAAVLFIILSANIYSSVKSYKYRRLCDKYREQLIAAETTNRELTDRFGRVAEIAGRIKETTNANITDARGIIETVEILRSQIKELEDCLGSFSQSEYYSYWDSYFRDEGLID